MIELADCVQQPEAGRSGIGQNNHQENPPVVAEMSGDHRTVIKGSPSQYVKLNVGGSLHYTTIGTLTKHDTMLRAMFSGRMEVLTDSEGMKHFQLKNPPS